jgi:hypothetical protein
MRPLPRLRPAAEGISLSETKAHTLPLQVSLVKGSNLRKPYSTSNLTHLHGLSAHAPHFAAPSKS